MSASAPWLVTPLGGVGPPPDRAAVACFVLGLVVLITALWRRRSPASISTRHAPAAVAVCATAAFGLSLAYVSVYLEGGPRIIDATSYFLQGRVFSSGSFTLPASFGTSALRGRFLIASLEEPHLGVIFPPGYPALLAAGFVVGAPMLVGPLTAAGLVIMSYRLARRLFDDVRVGLTAALLSALCAALRYHTADTMSHGLSALLLVTALYGAFGARRFDAALAGLASGWLFATRPVTGLVATIVCALLIARARPERRFAALGVFAVGLLPGLGLLAVYQYAVTGDIFASTQLAYYAVADGPAGCFGYGFGQQVGCLFEHGDFVRARLQDGFGLVEALGTTLRRLGWHLLDVANLELLGLAVGAAAWTGRHLPPIRWLALTIGAVMLGYAPFYFEGSYPGGGARLFADVLPLEHVLLGWALVRWRVASLAPAWCLVGFAVHASYQHVALREREGGRPMFEPDLLERAGVERGLLLVGTDHGFNLAHVPGARAPERELVVARWRGDDHDRVLWELLGRPPAHRYAFDPGAPDGAPRLSAYRPSADPTLRLELEHQWPPLAVGGGFAHPEHRSEPCSSAGRALRLRPAGADMTVRVELLAPETRDYLLRIGFVIAEAPATGFEIQTSGQVWVERPPLDSGCWTSGPHTVRLQRGAQPLEVTLRAAPGRARGGYWLDFVELSPK